MVFSTEERLGLLSMFLLVFQGTALSLLLRYSRTTHHEQYLPSVAVIFTELLKLIICIGAQFLECRREAKLKGDSVRTEFRKQYRDMIGLSVPLAVPAALFVLQQVLVIVAASHLDAVMFQIFSQSFKIIPTALFAVWLLGQQLTGMQWASLPVLVIGVILVTMNKNANVHLQSAPSDVSMGMLASSLSGLSSAYAGVYFEKYVKGKNSASLWIRNLQLSLYGLPLSIGYAIVKDYWAISQRGVFQGFNWVTWFVVFLQVFGGLIVGMVVKYADNILKNFANAISVILTVLGAIPLFGMWPSINFLLGVTVVLFSVFMYGSTIRLETLACTKVLFGCFIKRKSVRRTGSMDTSERGLIGHFWWVILLVGVVGAAGSVIFVLNATQQGTENTNQVTAELGKFMRSRLRQDRIPHNQSIPG